MGLNIAGVDPVRGEQRSARSRSQLFPGFEGIEKASGVNVAGAIVDYVMADTAFAEVDIGQLLRTVPGSGVLSLQLRNHPKMVGKRLDEVFASVPVFALSRGDRLVWNPEHDVQLRYDDVLCYGELTELRFAAPSHAGRAPRGADVRRAQRTPRNPRKADFVESTTQMAPVMICGRSITSGTKGYLWQGVQRKANEDVVCDAVLLAMALTPGAPFVNVARR